MPISFPGGFQIGNVEPIDTRYVVTSSLGRTGFSETNVYEGLLVYQSDSGSSYILVDSGSWDIEAGWRRIPHETYKKYTALVGVSTGNNFETPIILENTLGNVSASYTSSTFFGHDVIKFTDEDNNNLFTQDRTAVFITPGIVKGDLEPYSRCSFMYDANDSNNILAYPIPLTGSAFSYGYQISAEIRVYP